jgi:hypothetical protein
MKIDINDLTLGQIKELALNLNNKSAHPYEIGKAYFIRTVTMYHIGILKKVFDNELILSNASWIPDSGRFHDALKNGEVNEVEPFIGDIIVSRNAIIDVSFWNHEVPSKQK